MNGPHFTVNCISPGTIPDPFCSLFSPYPTSKELLLSPHSEDFPIATQVTIGIWTKGLCLQHHLLLCLLGSQSPRGCIRLSAQPSLPEAHSSRGGVGKSGSLAAGAGRLDRTAPGNVNGNSNRQPAPGVFAFPNTAGGTVCEAPGHEEASQGPRPCHRSAGLGPQSHCMSQAGRAVMEPTEAHPVPQVAWEHMGGPSMRARGCSPAPDRRGQCVTPQAPQE